jgi:hypothetical protein
MHAELIEVLSVRLPRPNERRPGFIWLSGQVGRSEQRLAELYVVGTQSSERRDSRVVVADGYPAKRSRPRQRLSECSLAALLGSDLLRDGVGAQGGNGKL